MSTGEFDHLNQAVNKLQEDIKKKASNISGSLLGLGESFEELKFFFLSSAVEDVDLLQEIKFALIKTYNVLSHVSKIDSSQLHCDSENWDFFTSELQERILDDFIVLVEAIQEYVSNIQDIQLEIEKFRISEIQRKNKLYSKSRTSIIKLLDDIRTYYYELVGNMHWHTITHNNTDADE